MARGRSVAGLGMSSTGTGGSKSRNFVTALARGLEILRAFGPGDEYLGNAELSERTGIPRPTVSRLTYTLTTLGYLRYSERLEKYQVDAGVLALGYRYLANSGVREVATPYMQRLADTTDCLVALGAAGREEMTYIQACQGNGPLVLRLDVGSRIPVATTSMGRAYLAALQEPVRERVLGELRRAEGERWPQIYAGIKQAMRQYRETGFCTSEGEWEREVSSVGVPLVLDGGAHVMAFNCGGASLRLSSRVLEENLGPRLVDLVAQVRTRLGS